MHSSVGISKDRIASEHHICSLTISGMTAIIPYRDSASFRAHKIATAIVILNAPCVRKKSRVTWQISIANILVAAIYNGRDIIAIGAAR